MMKGNEFALRVCDILGLNKDKTQSISIEMIAGKQPVAKVVIVLFEDDLDAIIAEMDKMREESDGS